MTSPISPLTSATADPSSNGPAKTSAQQQQAMFLQLLVAQLQNQDPLNPADGMTFVTQLAQFSQVETLLGIRGDLRQVIEAAAQQRAPSTTSA